MNFYIKEAYTCNTITFNVPYDDFQNFNFDKFRNLIIYEWYLKFRQNIYYFDIIKCGHGEEHDVLTTINNDILHSDLCNNISAYYIKINNNNNTDNNNTDNNNTDNNNTDNNTDNNNNENLELISRENADTLCCICYNFSNLRIICQCGQRTCGNCYNNILRSYSALCPFCRLNLLNNMI